MESLFIFDKEVFFWIYGGFVLTFYGIFHAHTNLIRFLISLEVLSLLSSIILILSLLIYMDAIAVLFIIINLIIAGCESAIGLILLINLYYTGKLIKLHNISNLKC